MPNERIIAKMKLVKQNQKRMQSKAEHRRTKVIAKLEEQLARSCPIAWCSFWLPLTAFWLARAVDVMPIQLAG